MWTHGLVAFGVHSSPPTVAPLLSSSPFFLNFVLLCIDLSAPGTTPPQALAPGRVTLWRPCPLTGTFTTHGNSYYGQTRLNLPCHSPGRVAPRPGSAHAPFQRFQSVEVVPCACLLPCLLCSFAFLWLFLLFFFLSPWFPLFYLPTILPSTHPTPGLSFCFTFHPCLLQTSWVKPSLA